MKKQLIEGEDFYYNDEGKMVMTAQYHIHRGYCCGNGCKHCPYAYKNVLNPTRKQELILAQQAREAQSTQHDDRKTLD